MAAMVAQSFSAEGIVLPGDGTEVDSNGSLVWVNVARRRRQAASRQVWTSA